MAAAATAAILLVSSPAHAIDPADTTAPTIADVGITPGELVNGTVTLQPTVSDDVAVTRVELRANHTAVAFSRTAPFTLTWNTRPHADIDVWLQLVAFDAAGNSTTSPVTVVHADNRAPFIVFPWTLTNNTSATPATSFTGVTPIDFAKHGVAADTAGIEVAIGSQILGTLTEAPWAIDWDTRAFSGKTTITARAWDNLGNTSTATSTVWADHSGPTISTTFRRSTTFVRAGDLAWVTTRDGAGVERVEFLVNGTTIGTNRSGQNIVAFTWPKDATNGTATLTIRAYDSLGNLSEQSRTVTVDNTPPAVTVSLTGGGLLRGLVNTAVTSVKDVAGIDTFSAGIDRLQTSDSSSPWRISLDTRTVRDGWHTVIWSVTDRAGNTTLIRRTATVDNTKPTVRITAAPKNKSVLRKTVKIRAYARDAYGINRVELLVNGKVVKTDRTAGYSFTLNPKRYGKKFTVCVRAYDRAGNLKHTSLRTYRR